jgi:hypothetical protein
VPESAPILVQGRHCAAIIIIALAYLGLALWSARAILPAPATTFQYPRYYDLIGWQQLIQSDQLLVAWQVTHNARKLVTGAWDLFDSGQCYPADRAVTLGEHMFVEGGLGIIPYVLSGAPILTYNTVIVVTIWAAALAMYALVYAWTKSVGAAFIAGLLFGLHPARIYDPIHLNVVGNVWTPLALLFAHRLFQTRRWRDAAGLTLFFGLQTLESFYPLFTLTLIASVYGSYLLLRYRRYLAALAPKLLVFATALAALAATILLPYLKTRATWGVPGGRGEILFIHTPRDFLVGGEAYAGSVLLVLAVVGLLDRMRRGRRQEDYDPRLIYLTAGLVCFWATVSGMTIPILDVHIPSLFVLASRVVPGPDAVRAPEQIRLGVYLVAAFLAGYGVLVLTERLRAMTRRIVICMISAVALVEIFYPPLGWYNFPLQVEEKLFGVQRPPIAMVDMKAYSVRPQDEVLGLYMQMEHGAVLDLPFKFDAPGLIQDMPYYVFLSAFHHRPVGACYNSFQLPVQTEIETLATRLPDAGAADALYALGFRTVIVHEERLSSEARAAFHPANLHHSRFGEARLIESGTAPQHRAYRLASPLPVDEGFSALAVRRQEHQVIEATPPAGALTFVFRNESLATYRHPSPIEPTPLLVRWYDASDEMIAEYSVRTLLPLALAPGDDALRTIAVPVPVVSGESSVTLAPATAPELVIAKLTVHVTPRGGLDGANR